MLISMKIVAACIFAALVIGCKPPTPTESAATPPTSAAQTTTESTAPSGGSGSVAPMAGGAATGMSPMSGTESVEGAGMGGLGQAAKDQARRAAAGAANGGAAATPDSGE